MADHENIEALTPLTKLDSNGLAMDGLIHHAWLYDLSVIPRDGHAMCSITDVLPRPFDVSEPVGFLWGVHYLTAQGKCVMPSITTSYAEGSQGNLVISEPVKLAHVDAAALATAHKRDSKLAPEVGTTIDIPPGLFQRVGGGMGIELAPSLAQHQSGKKAKRKSRKGTGGARGLYTLPAGHTLEHALVLAALVTEAQSVGDAVRVFLAKPIHNNTGYEIAEWHSDACRGAGFRTLTSESGKIPKPGPNDVWVIVDETRSSWVCSGVHLGSSVEDTLVKTFRSWRMSDDQVDDAVVSLSSTTCTQLVESDQKEEQGEGGSALQMTGVVCNRAILYGSATWDPDTTDDAYKAVRMITAAEHHRLRDTSHQSPHCFHDGYLCLAITMLRKASNGHVDVPNGPVLEIGYKLV